MRSLEVTYGANGWHVHLHKLVLLGADFPEWAIPVLESDLATIGSMSWVSVVMMRRGIAAWRLKRPTNESAITSLNMGMIRLMVAGQWSMRSPKVRPN